MEPAIESRLEDVERKSASCYAEMELAGFRMAKLAEELDEDDGVVAVSVEDNDSLVTQIEDVRKTALEPVLPPDPKAGEE